METKNAGISDIVLYVPETTVDMEETYAEANGIDPAKFTEGLGIEQMMLPDAYEDAATMAAEASLELIEANNVDPGQIDRLAVATESSWDNAKPISTYVAGMLEDVLGEDSLRQAAQTEHKFACLAGTQALHDTANQLLVEGGEDSYGIVVASDTAWYARESSGEPTQGAGAVAMLVETDPDVVDLGRYRGVATSDETDFLKPRQHFPTVDGKYSQKVYLEHVADALDDLAANEAVDDIDAASVHTPFPHMVEKAAPKIYDRIDTDQEYDEFVETKITPGIQLSRKTGNLYTGSLHLARLSMLLHDTEVDQLLTASYGSGAGAEASLEEIQDGYDSRLSMDPASIHDQFEGAYDLDWEEYTQLHDSHNPDEEADIDPFTRPQGFVRSGNGSMGERTYLHIS